MGFMKELQGQKMVSNIFSTAKSTNFSFIFLYQILYELKNNMARKPEVAESNLILEKIPSSLSLSLSVSWGFFISLSPSRFISYTLSQTKLLAIMLILLVFFLAYSLHQFFFRPICLFVLRNKIKRQLPVSIKFSQSLLAHLSQSVRITENVLETFIYGVKCAS